MVFFDIVMPVAVGALIGYCTNFIAIKMLFRPRNEVWIGNVKLPFTPGIIPKNKDRIAKSISDAVCTSLVTKDDILGAVNTGSLEETFVENVMDTIFVEEKSLKDYACEIDGNINTSEVKRQLSDGISDKLMMGINKVDFEQIFSKMSNQAFQEMIKNPIVALFLNEKMIKFVSEKMSSIAKQYVEDNGKSIIYPMVESELVEIANQSAQTALQSVNISREHIYDMVKKMYDSFIASNSSKLLETLDIRSIVEQKVNNMDIDELETMCMNVMKQELQAVINLGAVIGAIIGIINIFF